jgi:hypothetical protein
MVLVMFLIPTDTYLTPNLKNLMFVVGEPWDTSRAARAGEEGIIRVLQAKRRRLQELWTCSESEQAAGGRRHRSHSAATERRRLGGCVRSAR